MKIAHVITSLASAGGAQTMLYNLVRDSDRSSFETEVISLMGIGPVGAKIGGLGVPVRTLGMRRGIPDPVGVWKLARWLRQDRPDLVQTWLYHADLIGGLAGKLAGSPPVVWNIRHGEVDSEGHKRTTRATAYACARLSRRLPARIVCCSESAKVAHARMGYAAERMVVIPNGFDLETWRPDAEARASVRRELGIGAEAILIGLVGRFHPLKDHRNFVAAAGKVHAWFPDAHYLLCGDEVTPENRELAGWIRAAGIADRCHLLGPRQDMSRLDAALDVAASSSYSEGFPNVIGEAMACGVPCVVTDVGDGGAIVGETGRVVPPRDPEALARGLQDLIEGGAEERRRLGEAARSRIAERFSLRSAAARYRSLYEEIAGRRPTV